jgi:hypothetical protein
MDIKSIARSILGQGNEQDKPTDSALNQFAKDQMANKSAFADKALGLIGQTGKGLYNQYVYNPETKDLFSQGLISRIADIAPLQEKISKGEELTPEEKKKYKDSYMNMTMMTGTISTPKYTSPIPKYTGKEGSKFLFKPKSLISKEDINVLDEVINEVNMDKELTVPNNNFLNNLLKSITGVSQDKLDDLTPTQKINEAVRQAKLAEKFYSK